MISFEEIDAINCFSGDRIFPLIMKHGQKRVCKAGEILYYFGDQADGLYYIHSGKIRGFYLDENGEDQTCIIVPPGMFVGEDCFTSSLTRVVGVDIVSDAVLYYISRDSLLELCKNDTGLLHQLLGMFTKKMVTFLNALNATQQSNMQKKIAYFLPQMERATSEPIDFTHERISDVTGISRENVSKTLGQFEAAGLIKSKYRQIEVLDSDGLFKLLM